MLLRDMITSGTSEMFRPLVRRLETFFVHANDCSRFHYDFLRPNSGVRIDVEFGRGHTWNCPFGSTAVERGDIRSGWRQKL
jgi:hypothetical protein